MYADLRAHIIEALDNTLVINNITSEFRISESNIAVNGAGYPCHIELKRIFGL